MHNEKLCTRCQTGRDNYLLDARSPECPYLSFCDGTSCKMYRELPKSKKRGFLFAVKKLLFRKRK